MATWDFGGGCACGVEKVCDCGHNKQMNGSVARPEEKKSAIGVARDMVMKEDKVVKNYLDRATAKQRAMKATYEYTPDRTFDPDWLIRQAELHEMAAAKLREAADFLLEHKLTLTK